MPLLQGKFDPTRLNEHLAMEMYRAEAGDDYAKTAPNETIPEWADIGEELRQDYLTTAQQIIEALAADGVIS